MEGAGAQSGHPGHCKPSGFRQVTPGYHEVVGAPNTPGHHEAGGT